MTTFGVVIVTALLVFCFRQSYVMGRRAGARRVIVEWQEWLKLLDEVGVREDD